MKWLDKLLKLNVNKELEEIINNDPVLNEKKTNPGDVEELKRDVDRLNRRVSQAVVGLADQTLITGLIKKLDVAKVKLDQARFSDNAKK